MKSVRADIRGETGINWFTFFTSSGTLVCCALPVILVSLGMGASVAAITSSFPFLIYLSQHKVWVFVLSGIMLALSTWLIYRAGQNCPSDPELARICDLSKKWNKRIYWSSVIIWGIGFFAAFLALPLRMTMGL